MQATNLVAILHLHIYEDLYKYLQQLEMKN